MPAAEAAEIASSLARNLIKINIDLDFVNIMAILSSNGTTSPDPVPGV